MKDSMLNKLKSGYEEMEVEASADLWERLDHKLDAVPERKSKIIFNGWKYAAVILLLISFGMIFYFNNPDRSEFRKTGYTLKDRSDRITYPEFSNPNLPDEVSSPKKEKEAMAGGPGKYAGKKAEIKTIQPEISKIPIQYLAIQPHGISVTAPGKIANTIPSLPEVAVAAETKATYISSNELLLGREFDKTSKPQNTDAIKFGVFDFDKPKIENITVLGVTVYTDTK